MLQKALQLIFLFVLSSFTISANAETGTLKVLGMENYPPFSFEKNGKMVGIDNEVMYEIGKRIGVEVEIDYLPWKRLLANLKYGSTDAAFALFFTQERNNLHYTQIKSPFMMAHFTFMLKKALSSRLKMSLTYMIKESGYN